jgi:HAE1 family hydrophobic/amphiphilic exporter-1
MIFVAAVVFGVLSYTQLPLMLMPELSYPTLTVRTDYPGAAPEEVEADISRPIEEALGVIGGLAKISSISRAGISDVVLEFSWDMDMDDASQEVLEKLDRVFLPVEAERPLILHYDPSLDPVLELSLSGEGELYEGESGLRRLRRIADIQLRRLLEPVKGVAAVRIRGGLEEEVHVLVDEGQLLRTGISIQHVIDRLAQENINLAGGTIKDGRTEYLVRTMNEFENLQQIEETVIASFDGRDVRIRDVGRVVYSNKEREIITRTDGGESVQIEIFKEGDANIVNLANRVKAMLGDDTRDDLLEEVRNTAMLGGLLAIFILFLFLRNVKATTIVAVSIPISLLVTFAPLNLLGVSLNIMSLGGLALGIGMLVDSSIVVLESIHRCREEGEGIIAAAIRGTGEVKGAVLASTLTSIAVFLPMVFVEGIAGQAFGDLGMAVVVSLLASAAVALYFIPMLASRRGVDLSLHSQGQSLGERLRRFRSLVAFREAFRNAHTWVKIVGAPYFVLRLILGLVFESIGKIVLINWVILILFVTRILVPFLGIVFGFLMWLPLRITQALLKILGSAYPRVLRTVLAHPVMVMAVMAACLWGTWAIGTRLNSELLPEVHQGEFTVEVALPVGTPLERTRDVLSPVEQAILAEKENIRSLLLTLGYDSGTSQRSDEGEHTAKFKILLDDRSRGAATEEAVIRRMRGRFKAIPDLDARIVRPVLFSSKTAVEVEVEGDSLVQLRKVSEEVRDVLATLPELADVESTLRSGAPEVQIIYDRDLLARFGLNINEVARLVRNKVQGYEATRYNLKDRRIPIVVRLAMEDRETVEEVRGLVVNPGQDRSVPLSAVADVVLGEGPSEVRRVDGQRVALVQANLAGGSLSAASARIEDALRSRVSWPEGMSYTLGGQNQEWERSRGSLWLALGLSMFLVYVIMAAQFESLLHPLVIMFTIPLAFLGSLTLLLVMDISLSIVVFLGMIMLAGIVVNNAIVLVDYINTLRARGMERNEAIVQAGSVRLRPILMTTATTVLGLLPMAIGLGDGAEIRTPMALTVIAGLLSSTFLTLLLIPSVYAIVDDMKQAVLGKDVASAVAGEKEIPHSGVEGAIP